LWGLLIKYFFFDDLKNGVEFALNHLNAIKYSLINEVRVVAL